MKPRACAFIIWAVNLFSLPLLKKQAPFMLKGTQYILLCAYSISIRFYVTEKENCQFNYSKINRLGNLLSFYIYY